MKSITSRTNTEIIKNAQLHHGKYRKERKQFLAEGLRVCSTLLQTPAIPLVTLYATEKGYDLLRQEGIHYPVTLVTDQVMAKLSTATTPSGIVGIFSMPHQAPSATLQAGIVLAQITDPGNMGSLIRTCVAFGVRSVIIIEGVDVWSPKVVQASAGTLGRINIFHYSWAQLMAEKPTHLQLTALVARNGQSLQSINHREQLLVLGNEAHGIPDAWLQQCDHQVTIPMTAATESLNAAIAGAIAVYEFFGKKC
jgi:TrmH family RNA methyltransferase